MKTKIKIYIAMMITFFAMNVNAQTAVTISGATNAMVTVAEDYTATVSGLANGCTVTGYTWSSISPDIKINAILQSSASFSVTTTSHTCSFEWDCTVQNSNIDNIFLTVDLSAGCGVGINTSNNVTIKGFDNAINISGPSNVQECCFDQLHYQVNSDGEGDDYYWSVPSGWTIDNGQNTYAITVTPDATTGGNVTCQVQISTADAACLRNPVKSVSRFEPVVIITAPDSQPCEGETVTYHASTPCGIIVNTFAWTFPEGWTNITVNGSSVSAYVSENAKPGKITLGAEFVGGCTTNSWVGVEPIHYPPLDPTFGECDGNQPMNPYCQNSNNFPLKICWSGTNIPIDDYTVSSNPEENPTGYNLSVSAPWKLLRNASSHSTISNLPVNEIQDIKIRLPNHNTTNIGVHNGSLRVEAINCIGGSTIVQLDFQREVDWWCDCGYYTECFCRPPSCHMQKTEEEQIQNNEVKKVLLSPNPNNGLFTLNLTEQQNTIVITDITGRVIHNSFVNEFNPVIDLSNHAAGIYFVSVNNGIENKVSKLIIQK